MINLDYLYKLDIAQKNLASNYFSDRKLEFSVIENGTILPHKYTWIGSKWTWGKGGIIDSNSKFIKSSFVHYGVGGAYTPPPQDINYSSETVIYLGMFYPVWGHVITDNIRRVWFLKSYFFKDFKNCPLVYIPFENMHERDNRNFKHLLEILGIDLEALRPITQPTQFDKIILPDESFFRGVDLLPRFTKEYRETIDCIRNFALKNRTPTSNKKLYFFYGRKEIGEDRLAEYFKSKGYDIISPEKLTFDEQLNLLINCNSFVSTLGSCSHNSIFLRNDIEAIFIPRVAKSLNVYQMPLNFVNSPNVTYIDSTLSVFSDWRKPFCYIISEQLKRFFGDKFDGYEEEDFKIFLQYVKFNLSMNTVVNFNAKDYYASILADFMEQLKKREDLITACDMPSHWEELRSLLTYQTHVHNKGWVNWSSEEQISNSLDQNLDIQAVKIKFPNHKVYYSVYYNDEEGWSDEVLAPEQAGTTGKGKSIFGIRVWLDEADSKEFDILYRLHKFDGEWTPWAKNGEALYSYGVKLNAIQMKLEPKLTTTKA